MSSSTRARALALVVLVALVAFATLAIGCGRSPAMPRSSATMVRVENGRAVPCDCGGDDDDDDDLTSRRRKPGVEYVHISEWQAPESAQRAASEVVPRGAGTPTYVEFPKLTLHKPIPETTFGGRRSATFR